MKSTGHDRRAAETESALTGIEIAETVWWALRRCSPVSQTIEVAAEPVTDEDISSDLNDIEDAPAIPPPPLPPPETQAEIAPDLSSSRGAASLPEGYQPIRVEDPAALPDPLALARSLRPLLRWVAFGEPRRLDEIATVDRIAQTGIWQLVLRRQRELMFDVALVFDTSPSMALWLRFSQDVCRLLSRYGEFRRLELWKLVFTASGEIALRSPRSETQYPTSRLITQDRRRIVLVMSDCVAPSWRDRGIWDVLHDWSRSMPTAIVQVFPEHLWPQTALGLASAVQLRVEPHHDRVALPSQGLTATAHSFLARKRIATATTTGALRLPIVSLEPQPLLAWARLVAGDRQVRVPGILWEALEPQRSPPKDEPLNAKQPQRPTVDRLDLFLRTASPTARELAALLAASPLVMLPVVRIVQRALLPRSRPSHVAEVFASGLFAVASAEPPTLDNAETVIYQLAEPGYRSRLLERLPTIDRVVVIEKVSSYVVQGLNTSMSAFRALLRDPRRAAVAEGDSDRAVNFFSAFAMVTADVLRGLGGQFDEFAQRLVAGVEAAIAVPPSFELEAFEYESVETLGVLKRFEFETATIAMSRGFMGLLGRKPVITRRRGSNWGYTEKLSEEIGLDMMSIPGGTFQMGSPDNEPDRDSSESPQHEVTVSPFFLGRYAITQDQWRIVASYPQIEQQLEPEPSYFKDDNDHRPVEQVSWDEVVEFCQRLSVKTGKTYRLPSEAEWEYACRAGTITAFHFGDRPSVALMNYDGKYTYNGSPKGEYRGKTVEVGSFPPNNFGLCDMHGNVWEWCEDDWHESYEGAPTDGSAWTEEKRTQTNRLLRGGSWDINPRGCRSAYRVNSSRDIRSYRFGFRVVCAAPRTS